MFTFHFIPNDKGNPPGKLADVELHFTEIEQDCPACQGKGDECQTCEGRQTIPSPFGGLKFIGFAVWERRGGGRNVTFPARQYAVNGERRSFALLRPIADAFAQEPLRSLILDAYARFEEVGR
jgi:hypothetical protein